MLTSTETIPFAPELNIPNLRLRHWRDDADYAHMGRIVTADKRADGVEHASTVDDMKAYLQAQPGMDVAHNVFLLEHDRGVIAYQTVRAYPEANGAYCYHHQGYVMPAWKGRGIGGAMVQHAENELLAKAAQHPANVEKYFQVYLENLQTGLEHLLQAHGYTAVRYFYEMVRPNLDNIPDAPLPAGIEVRPVQPDQFRRIWEADVEAFKNHWGETDHGEEDYTRWLKRPYFQPDLWQVAWDGDNVTAVMTNFIDTADNAAYNRRRGTTEDIGTLEPYRGRGLAQALIARSLLRFKALGLNEATLDVDTENASGALKLYLKMGYAPTKTIMAYRKPLLANI